MIEIRIGMSENPKELAAELEETTEEFIKKITAAIKSGTGVFWVTDSRGKKTGVASAKIAYIEIEPEGDRRPVGFGGR